MNNEWKMVPAITTLEMDRAAISSGESDDLILDIHQIDRIWSAMLAAAPVPPAGQAFVKPTILKETNVGYAAVSGATVPPAGDVARFCIYNEDGKLSVRVAADGYWCRHDDFTRLTAERDGLLAQLTESRRQVQLLNEAGEFLDDVSQGVEDKLRAENAALQSELTKARELLRHMQTYSNKYPTSPIGEYKNQIAEVLAHQSAPAANGGE